MYPSGTTNRSANPALPAGRPQSFGGAGTEFSSITAVQGNPQEDSESTERARKQAFLQLARDRFRISALAEEKRRGEMLLDQKFRCGRQWDEPIERVRRQQGRPCLTINRVDQFVKHVTNSIRQARPEIKVDPRGDGADEEIAEIRQGLIRHILVNSRAEIAEDVAFENMATMGLGYIRVLDAWADPASMDKDLFVEWVPNSFSVYEDPAAIRPDWTDGKYKFVVEDIPLPEFKLQYPKSEAASLDGFTSIGDHARWWMVDGKVRVAEYWYYEYVDDTACELADGTNMLFSQMDVPAEDADQEEMAAWQQKYQITATRPTKVPKVKWAKISGVDILDERDWPGKYIPIIPVIGNQIELDGEKMIVGMVRYAIESQRMFNYMYSSFVETIALAPRAPWVAEFDQINEFRSMYEVANTQPQAVLPYRAKVVEGLMVPPPQRQQAEPPIAAFVEGLKLADNNMKAAFGIYDASLGQKGPQESGIAINSRKVESENATFDWTDNFNRGLALLGIVLNDLLQYYYNSEGRIVQIIREDLEQEAVMFNKAYQRQGKPAIYDLSKGKFSVSISTGPSFSTRRQEASQAVLKLAQIWPPFVQACGPDIVRMLDFPEKDRFASQLEKLQPPELRAADQDQDGPNPEQLKQGMAQQQQLIQQLTQVVNTLSDKKESDREKELWDTFRTQMQQETQLAIAQLKVGSDEAKMLSAKLFEEMERIRLATEALMQQPPAAGGTPGPPQPQQGTGPASDRGPTSSPAPASAAAQPQAPGPTPVPTPQGGGLPGTG